MATSTTPSAGGRYLAGAAVVAICALLAGFLTPGSAAARRAPHQDLTLAVDSSFPDPGFLKAGGRYYLYATGGRFEVQGADSPDGPFTRMGTALTEKPAWALEGGHRWAPHVFAAGGRYVMYFTATRSKDSSGYHDCTGVAVSDRPDGGFTPVRRLACTTGNSTMIDPSHFRTNDGRRFLVYKARGYRPSTYQIRAVEVTSNGLKVKAGARSFKLVDGGDRIVEAPSLVKHGGRLWLFTSRRNFATCGYRTEVYSASGLHGRFRSEGLLSLRHPTTNKPFCGPGGAEVISTAGGARIAFHVWKNKVVPPTTGATRVTWTGALRWDAKTGRPSVALTG